MTHTPGAPNKTRALFALSYVFPTPYLFMPGFVVHVQYLNSTAAHIGPRKTSIEGVHLESMCDIIAAKS
jgi:hypothetical protein